MGDGWRIPVMQSGSVSTIAASPITPYVYRRLTFDLTGLDPTTASISGTGSADDSAIIRLNGNATGQTFPAFNVLSTFSITSGFIAGVNTLDFVVSNGGAGPNPTGLLVNSLSGTARLQTDQRGFGSPRIRGSSIDIGAVEAGRTTIDLSNLGPAGTIINGQAAGNQSGYSVSDAGDVNGDGFDDFLVGAPFAAPGSPARSNAGKSYVIFGGSSLPATIDLSDNLSTTNPGVGGFTILGEVANDYSGRSVSSAGDVNGDGFDDLIVGVYRADPGSPARNNSGKSYVIFGKPDWSTTPTITLSDTLSTTNPGVGGFTIFGADTGDQSGFSASSAGDVNGDGFDDLIVGAPFAAPANLPLANNSAGKSYVIFGGSSLPATITLSDTLSTTNPGVGGFTILGQATGDNSGRSVSSAGDVNGDGFDDIIVGALYADPSSPARSNAGKSYVIFGKSDWSTTPTIILSDTLSTTNPGVGGFTILGQVAVDGSGRSVSSAGDVNGDGFDDLIVGAFLADPGSPARNDAGKSYVIFGGSSLPATITLSDTLSTTNPGVGGFTILGEAANDRSGRSVSSAGDVNGDGFDDLIVGALYADPGSPARNNAGKSYVIFGGSSLPATIILSDTLSTTNPGFGGFTILGQTPYDRSGRSVSSAGDVNGDGFDDLIVGASFAAPGSPARNNAGKSYLIFGGNGFTNSILPANLGTGVANTITGTAAANILNGADGSDSLIGNGGADVLLGGRGNDILAVSDLNFRRIVGGNGNDTLRLDGTGLSLNLSSIRDNRIIDIETIDITGSGNNTLTLNQREVLNISSSTNTLTVVGNAEDRVVIETGWNRQADDGGFQILTKRAATLRVSTGVTIEITPVIDLANLSVDGTIINGQAASDESGYSVSDAGDVNGDGFDDLIVGAISAAPGSPARDRAGKSYVIFGGSSLPATITLLDTLSTTNPGVGGFTILGEVANDYSGRSVSSAGDVNGDGFDDLIVGATGSDPGSPARNLAGKSFVIFGKPDWSTTPTIILSDTLGTTNPGVGGFTILGQAAFDRSGVSVSSAGDVNGDGFDDLIVGALYADPSSPARSNAGKSYVIFGGSSLPSTITLSDSLSTTNPGVGGFTILGQAASDRSGVSVSSAGDVNGDGFDDLIVGAFYADPSSPARSNAGKSYVIFGGSSLPTTITLSDSLSTTNPGVGGFTILGQTDFDRSGGSVSSAGDVNGDGFDDLIVGASFAAPGSPARELAGKSYVIFGKSDWIGTPTIDLASNNLGQSGGPAGFTILGQAAVDFSGRSVSSAGDVNGDGFDDLIVGASFADPDVLDRLNAGKSYVIFGKSDWSTTPTITLSDTLATTNPGVTGFTILGQAAFDGSGGSVSGAGDVNGDGFDDLIVGALGADPANLAANNNAGKSYLIFGGNGFTNSILPANLGESGANVLLGDASANRINGAGGNDLVSGGGGADVLLGGRGNDILAVSDLNFSRIVGGNGNDTLRLDGSGMVLNLTTIPDNRLQGIEEIDITGVNANNTLILNHREVLNLSGSSNTLIVRRNAGDVVNIGAGWTQLANELIGVSPFLVYAQGQARLQVQAVGTASVANRQIFYNRSTSTVFGDGTGNPINSIDPSKQALLPGQTASFANVTNYVRGLNGIVVDIANVGGLITAGDFQFATSNGASPLSFATLAAAPTITILPRVVLRIHPRQNRIPR